MGEGAEGRKETRQILKLENHQRRNRKDGGRQIRAQREAADS